MSIKRKLLDKTFEVVNERIAAAKDLMNGVQMAANQETKSSSGDKYETGRTMMHLEMEKHASQLAEAMKTKQVLQQIDPEVKSQEIRLGSVVITDSGNFFLSVSAGAISVDGEVYQTVSLASPIGKALSFKTVNDAVQVHKTTYKIISIS